MRFHRATLLILSSLAALVATALVATARADGNRPRVTFYEHADFRGASRTIEVGEGLENLSRERFSNGAGMNDGISSIKIEGGARVRAFQDAGFRGDENVFDFSIKDLNDSAPGWNDAISSLRVDRGGGRPAGPGPGHPVPPPPDRRPETPDWHGGGPRVTLYEHAGFQGASRTVPLGGGIENLAHESFGNGGGMNDRVSSIKIEGGAQLVAYQDAGFRGDVKRFAYSVSDLNDSAPGWNDAISSLRVERDRGDHRPDRAGPPDFQRTDEIIRRAYRDLLRRDPDDGGLRDYRRHMIQDNWNEAQVRHSIRESEEFRNLADSIITNAYRELLGREPSNRERARYREQMVERSASEEDVRRAIRATDEYRMRQKQRR